MSLILKGKLKITRIDVNTGKVLDVDEGNNFVLNTGLVSTMNLISGLAIVPSELIGPAGKQLNQFSGPVPTIAKFIQFGTNPNQPTPTDASLYPNGSLDADTINPSFASEIITLTPTIINQTIVNDADLTTTTTIGVNLHAEYDHNQGNGPNGASGSMTYNEAVLMGLTSVTPLIYTWFARRAFSGKIKDNTVKLVADWTITCEASEVLA